MAILTNWPEFGKKYFSFKFIGKFSDRIRKERDTQVAEMCLQIKDIKDDVEYYIENCQEPDFCENDMMYDDIEGFEEMMLDLSNVSVKSYQCSIMQQR